MFFIEFIIQHRGSNDGHGNAAPYAWRNKDLELLEGKRMVSESFDISPNAIKSGRANTIFLWFYEREPGPGRKGCFTPIQSRTSLAGNPNTKLPATSNQSLENQFDGLNFTKFKNVQMLSIPYFFKTGLFPRDNAAANVADL